MSTSRRPKQEVELPETGRRQIPTQPAGVLAKTSQASSCLSVSGAAKYVDRICYMSPICMVRLVLQDLHVSRHTPPEPSLATLQYNFPCRPLPPVVIRFLHFAALVLSFRAWWRLAFRHLIWSSGHLSTSLTQNQEYSGLERRYPREGAPGLV